MARFATLPVSAMSTVPLAERHAAFRALHRAGCFILPNPWDPGSARWLAHAGFKALASTSAGYAFSRGRADRELEVEDVLRHCRELVAATGLPVNADFEDGYARDHDTLAANVRRCVETGVSALSIEDSMPDNRTLYDFDEAVARMRVARHAIDAVDPAVMLVGRAECFLVGQPDLDDTVRRLCAYAEVGADCLYAPGLHDAVEIRAVVEAVAPLPVNVMMGPVAGMGMETLAGLGVRRISTASALAMAAWTGFTEATQALLEGRLDGFANTVTYRQLGELFGG